jgi:DNA-binding transcriptional regulator GbsR (MarR family)
MLQGLGMSSTAESVYLQMLRDRDAGPDGIAEALGIDEAAVRAALDELSRLMLVEQSWAGDDGFRPVSPEVGLAALLAREQAQVARRNQEIEEGRVALARLVSELQNVRKGPDVEVFETAEEARDRLATLTEQCTQELCTFVPTRATSSRVVGTSPTSASPSWVDELINPGVTHLPDASILRASAGIEMPAPTAVIFPLLINTVPLSIGGAETGKMRPPVMAIVCPAAPCATAAVSTQHAVRSAVK